MGELGKVYSCVVCHKAFDNRYSLLAHSSRAHKDKMVKTSVRIPEAEWSKFVKICEEHHTTTCHVLSSLVKAWNVGAEAGYVNVASPNPVQINIHTTFLGKPKSPWKTPIAQDRIEVKPRPSPPKHLKVECEGCYIDDDNCISSGAWKDERRCKRDW